MANAINITSITPKEFLTVITTLIIAGVASIFGLGTLASMVYTAKEREEVIIESFGKYVKTVTSSGLKMKLPAPFQKIANRISTAMREAKEDLKTKTKDDIFVTLPIKIHLQVEDTQKFNYNAKDPLQQVLSRVAATVKQEAASMDLADLYKSRQEISQNVCTNVAPEILELYGVKMVDVIVDEPQVPSEIQNSYNNVRASAQKAVAAENEAKADKIRVIAAAEARKESLKLDGEGIAAQRKAIFDNYAEQFNMLASKGLSKEQAHEVIIRAMDNDTIRDAADKGNMILTTAGAANNPVAAVKAAMHQPGGGA